MTVYVDDPIWPFRGKKWCHMTAHTHDELHAFARKLGLKRQWFQDKDHHQHYDLTASKRQMAIDLGAVAVGWRDYPRLYAALPINMGWPQLCLEEEADLAIGYSEEELTERAYNRYMDWKADRALELPKKRRRPSKAA